MSTFPTDAEREAVAYRLVHHYRVGLSNGECLCGHKVPLGHSFTAHQADEALNALSDLVAAREARAAAKALREAAAWLDSFEGSGGRTSAHDRAGRDIIRLLRERADRIERGEKP